MKLLNYTSSYFAAVLLVLLAIWAVVFYFEMLDEIYDSLDDGLENHKLSIIRKAQENPEILDRNTFGEGNYAIQKFKPKSATDFEESYRDTLMYMQNEKDFEPVRLLETVFQQDGSFYKMKVITSMIEEDDLMENLLYSMLFLYLGLMASILLLNNLIMRKTWRPFYRLLSQLKDFNIEKKNDVKFEKTNIEEFLLLNKNIERLLEKSKSSYENQKQFTENAAHELQTPLAISLNQLELFIENDTFNEEQIKGIASVIDNLERLTRFNKSLLLLSKIENRQYPGETKVDIPNLVKQGLVDFEDLAKHRSMSFKIKKIEGFKFNMNANLAAILFTNLIKNAIFHGEKGSEIEIEIENRKISIKNQAGNKTLEKSKLFERFQKQGKTLGSTGLGLAISKAIADRYGILLDYLFTNGHIFSVEFPNSKGQESKKT